MGTYVLTEEGLLLLGGLLLGGALLGSLLLLGHGVVFVWDRGWVRRQRGQRYPHNAPQAHPGAARLTGYATTELRGDSERHLERGRALDDRAGTVETVERMADGLAQRRQSRLLLEGDDVGVKISRE